MNKTRTTVVPENKQLISTCFNCFYVSKNAWVRHLTIDVELFSIEIDFLSGT
jgi:hypothetical protein